MVYEENVGRFPVAVNYLQGKETPRCDIISFSSDEIRNSVKTSQMLDPTTPENLDKTYSTLLREIMKVEDDTLATVPTDDDE